MWNLLHFHNFSFLNFIGVLLFGFVMKQKTNQICLSVCTPTNGGDGFYITTPAAAAGANADAITAAAILSAGTTTCQYDFLLIPGASSAGNIAADRYCGNELNPATNGVASSVSICSKSQNCAHYFPRYFLKVNFIYSQDGPIYNHLPNRWH